MTKKLTNSLATITIPMLASLALMAFTLVGYPEVASTVEADKLSNYKQRQYKKDATRLALRMISGNGDYTAISPEVPQDLVESIYNALVAIHLSGTNKAHEVTKSHKLHTFPVPNVDHFSVIYRRDAPWAVPLRLGDNETDNEQINALCQQFGLIIENHVEWDEEQNAFSIRAKQSLNLAPIAKEFLNIQGIEQVDMHTPGGDGNDIEIKQLPDGWEIHYLVKFGSCLSGCENLHRWSFAVKKDGNVHFVGESGDELPDWMQARD
ncbi:MAG: hypothetical protein AAFO94_20055 [Bacteroidota bacterium]